MSRAPMLLSRPEMKTAAPHFWHYNFFVTNLGALLCRKFVKEAHISDNHVSYGLRMNVFSQKVSPIKLIFAICWNFWVKRVLLNCLSKNLIITFFGSSTVFVQVRIFLNLCREGSKKSLVGTVRTGLKGLPFLFSRLREMSPLWEMFQEGIDIKSIKWTQH